HEDGRADQGQPGPDLLLVGQGQGRPGGRMHVQRVVAEAPGRAVDPRPGPGRPGQAGQQAQDQPGQDKEDRGPPRGGGSRAWGRHGTSLAGSVPVAARARAGDLRPFSRFRRRRGTPQAADPTVRVRAPPGVVAMMAPPAGRSRVMAWTGTVWAAATAGKEGGRGAAPPPPALSAGGGGGAPPPPPSSSTPPATCWPRPARSRPPSAPPPRACSSASSGPASSRARPAPTATWPWPGTG